MLFAWPPKEGLLRYSDRTSMTPSVMSRPAFLCTPDKKWLCVYILHEKRAGLFYFTRLRA